MRVLIVEDDAKIADLTAKFLASRGHETKCVKNAKEMDAVISRQRFDAIVLDIMLPGEDGLSVVRRLRALNERTPIIVVSARGEDTDKIVGLEMGADDYLAKPFNPRELEARLSSIVRRSEQMPNSAPEKTGKKYLFGKWTLDTELMSLMSVDGEVGLTTAEFSMLKVFVSHPKIVLSRDRLMDLTDGRDRDAFDRSIDVRVVRLRKLIEADPSNPKFIKTVRGSGYVFVPAES